MPSSISSSQGGKSDFFGGDCRFLNISFFYSVLTCALHSRYVTHVNLATVIIIDGWLDAYMY